MSPSNKNAGFLTRRGSAVTRRRGATQMQVVQTPNNGTTNGTQPHIQILEAPDDDPCVGVWVYPEIMDVIALVAALGLTVAITAMCAYSQEEMVQADWSYHAYHDANGLDGLWAYHYNQKHPVSAGLMIFATLSSAMSSFALVLAVAVRILMTYITRMKVNSERRAFLLRWANPLAVFNVLLWSASVILTAPVLYAVAWVAFPAEVAVNRIILVAGGCFCSAVVVMVLMGLYILGVSISLKKKEDKANAQVKQATSISSNGSSVGGVKEGDAESDIFVDESNSLTALPDPAAPRAEKKSDHRTSKREGFKNHKQVSDMTV